jgi:hypothetical protein
LVSALKCSLITDDVNSFVNWLISANLTDLMGELFLPCEMPEPPKEGLGASLLRGLFGGGTRVFDREELCKFLFNLKFSYSFVTFMQILIYKYFFQLENQRRVKRPKVSLG